MITSNQIIDLIKLHGESNDIGFFATAMKIAANEARKGDQKTAKKIKNVIDFAKKKRNMLSLSHNRTISLYSQEKNLQDYIGATVPNFRDTDLVVNDTIEESLNIIKRDQKNWQKLKSHNLPPRRKVIFYGPSGVGKTMSASILANELQIPLFIIKLDAILSSDKNNSISKLNAVFDAMHHNRAIYLFRELDFINRQYFEKIEDAKHFFYNLFLKIHQDDSNSVLIITVNSLDFLDKKVLDFIDEIVPYVLPTGEEIFLILKNILSTYMVENELNLNYFSKIALGLNHYGVVKATKDALKDMILKKNNILQKKVLEKAIFREKEKYGTRKFNSSK